MGSLGIEHILDEDIVLEVEGGRVVAAIVNNLDDVFSLEQPLQAALAHDGWGGLHVEDYHLPRRCAHLKQCQLAFWSQIDTLSIEAHRLADTQELLHNLRALPDADHHP